MISSGVFPLVSGTNIMQNMRPKMLIPAARKYNPDLLIAVWIFDANFPIQKAKTKLQSTPVDDITL